MEKLGKARNIVQHLSVYACAVGVALLIPMMLLTTTDVISRVAWAMPIEGAKEVSEYMLAVLILLGLAYTHQAKANVKVSFLSSRLPPNIQPFVEIITVSISLFIIFLLFWKGWGVALKEPTVSYMLRIPQKPFRLLVSVGGCLLFLELLIEFADTLKKLVRR